ncbi:MAG: hypothetical protein K2X47_02155, partial [Bdellovibrionales bacterium]|nr:hypothetical protein [Bdellovibrionales bacterium]
MKSKASACLTMFFTGMFACSAYCVDKPIPQPTAQKIQELINRLPRSKEDTTLYHWTKYETWARWVANGEIRKQEFDALVRDGETMLAGGGLYLAQGPDSSRSYGDFGLKILIRKGSIIFDHAIAKEVLGISFDDISNGKAVKLFKTELGKTVPFIDPYMKPEQGDTWWVTHHSSYVLKSGSFVPLHSASSGGIQFGNNSHLTFDGVQSLLQADDVDSGSKDYLQHLLAILYYGNTSLFFRALHGSPGNLESVMSTDQANRVNRTISKWLTNANSQKGLAAIQGFPRQKWVESQMQKVLPQIYADITGKPTVSSWRTKIFPPTTIFVDAFQAEAIRSNLSLKAQIKKISDHRFQVTFSYPEPTSSLQSLPQVLGQIYDTLAKTPAQLFERLGELASLAPFAEANDPVIRTYLCFLARALDLGFQVGAPVMGQTAHPIFLQKSEDALLYTDKSLINRIRSETARTNRIAIGMLAEIRQAQIQSRMPQYQHLPEQRAYPETYAAYGDLRPNFLISNFIAAFSKKH